MFNLLIFLAFLCREQPPPRGCVLKPHNVKFYVERMEQPPPRGCVLKPTNVKYGDSGAPQPPPRGCVLKPFFLLMSNMVILQPPPRGCVLKQETNKPKNESSAAAASARLCVETFQARGLFIF